LRGGSPRPRRPTEEPQGDADEHEVQTGIWRDAVVPELGPKQRRVETEVLAEDVSGERDNTHGDDDERGGSNGATHVRGAGRSSPGPGLDPERPGRQHQPERRGGVGGDPGPESALEELDIKEPSDEDQEADQQDDDAAPPTEGLECRNPLGFGPA